MAYPFEIAYILKGFPRLSETFISNEIYLLERMGLNLRVFSVKKPGEGKVHPRVKEIGSPVHYLPEATSLSQRNLFPWLLENLPRFVKAHGIVFRKYPLRYLTVAGRTLWMCVKYRESIWAKPKKVFIKEFLQAGWIAARIQEQSSVRHLHGHFSHGATTITMFVGQLTGLPFSFTAHAKDIYQKKLNPGDMLNRKLEKASFVVTCTLANKEFLESLCSGKGKINAIYHGLDTGFFVPDFRSRESDPPVILSVGRFEKKKGFDYLVRACRILKDSGLRFQCQIVGETGELLEPVRKLINDLDLRDTVRIDREVDQDALRSIYAGASIFALPCRIVGDGDRDGIPNVLVEAMAMGVPVVSTRISGIPELIRDGENGLLIPQKSAESLAEALKRLITDSKLRARLSHASRETVCREFDSGKTIQQLKSLFISESLSTGGQ